MILLLYHSQLHSLSHPPLTTTEKQTKNTNQNTENQNRPSRWFIPITSTNTNSIQTGWLTLTETIKHWGKMGMGEMGRHHLIIS